MVLIWVIDFRCRLYDCESENFDTSNIGELSNNWGDTTMFTITASQWSFVTKYKKTNVLQKTKHSLTVCFVEIKTLIILFIVWIKSR